MRCNTKSSDDNAGQRQEAVKTYERFCEQYPSHRAIGDVRALTESLGGHCP